MQIRQRLSKQSGGKPSMHSRECRGLTSSICVWFQAVCESPGPRRLPQSRAERAVSEAVAAAAGVWWRPVRAGPWSLEQAAAWTQLSVGRARQRGSHGLHNQHNGQGGGGHLPQDRQRSADGRRAGRSRGQTPAARCVRRRDTGSGRCRKGRRQGMVDERERSSGIWREEKWAKDCKLAAVCREGRFGVSIVFVEMLILWEQLMLRRYYASSTVDFWGSMGPLYN